MLSTDNKPQDTDNPKGSDSSKNIFSMPIAEKKKNRIKDEQKQKNKRNSFIYLGTAVVLLMIYAFFFLYPQSVAYLGFNKKIDGINKQVTNYKATLSDLAKKKDLHKATYNNEFKEEQKIMYKVFPKTIDKLDIIKLLEKFATHLNTTDPPFKFTSISFQSSKKENGYTVLPFRTSIKSSQKNFDRFLALINLSGDTDPKITNHMRLMEVTNISLRYKGLDKDGKDQGVEFDVKLNAYSR